MPKSKSKEKMALISIHVQKWVLEELDRLVERGVYPSRSEAIRVAIQRLLEEHGVKPAAVV